MHISDEEAKEREEEERRKQQEEEYECLCDQKDCEAGDQDQERYAESDGKRSRASENEGIPQIVEPDEETDAGELEISVKSNEEDESMVKKYIVSYESKVETATREAKRSRDPSPAPSQCTGKY